MLTLSAFSHVNHCFRQRRTRLGRVRRHGVRTRRHGSRGLDHHHPKVHLWQCFSPVVRLMVQKSGIHQLRLGVSPMFIPLSRYLFSFDIPGGLQAGFFHQSVSSEHLMFRNFRSSIFCLNIFINTFRYSDIIFPNATSWTCAQSFCELRAMSLQEKTIETGGRHQKNEILNNNKLSATKYAS